jgi:single-stranded-DNA-specific exonuclease
MTPIAFARERISVRALDTTAVSRLAQELEIPFAAAGILIGRNLIDPDVCRRFFKPSLADFHDPFLFRDMEKAVARILTAVANKEKIAVYGDYDVDGISSTAILMRVLKTLGGNCFYHLPHRLTDGYGLSESGIAQIAESGATLLVTVDCGVTSVGEIAQARGRGIDCIITDHHEPKQTLPDAFALINPKIDGSGYPDKDLAGVGVVLKLCQALSRRSGRGDSALWEPYLDLAALGTAADIVPLLGENRIIARFGFERFRTTANAGLAALIELQGLRDKSLSTSDIVFQLAPCINAAGRLGDPRRAVELLLTDDPLEAQTYARELRTANFERRSIDAGVWEEASAWVTQHCDADQDFAIVTGSANWHPGVIGIVASKLVEKFHRPAILFSIGNDGHARGSGRSIAALHLLSALQECADLLDSFGGHKAAAGVSLPSASIGEFGLRFNEVVRKRLTPQDLVPQLIADAELSLSAITPKFFAFIKTMEPFGPGNIRPVLYCRNLRKAQAPRIVGGKHLKMALSGDGLAMDAIAFNFGDRLDELTAAPALSIAFAIDENEWNGKKSLQMKVKGIAV